MFARVLFVLDIQPLFFLDFLNINPICVYIVRLRDRLKIMNGRNATKNLNSLIELLTLVYFEGNNSL